MRAGQYAYRDRRNKKRDFRTLWIARINACSPRSRHEVLSTFMGALKPGGLLRSTARYSPTWPSLTRRRYCARGARQRRPRPPLPTASSNFKGRRCLLCFLVRNK